MPRYFGIEGKRAMKKAMLFVMFSFAALLALSGCGQADISDMAETEASEITQQEDKAIPATATESAHSATVVENTKILWERDSSFDWQGSFSADAAGRIAEALLSDFQDEGLFSGYQLQLLEHDPDQGIWQASFWPDPMMPGADLVIAFRDDNLQIVGMWVGE